MIKGTFNNLINFEYNEDFNVLTTEENKKYFSDNLLRFSLHNKEKHIILSISKSDDSFLNRLFSIKTVINGALNNMKSRLKDFELIEEYETTIFNNKAITGCFSYTPNDEKTKQYGELSVFKVKSSIYAVYCLSRLEGKEENKEVFKQFKDSFKA